MNSEAKKLVNIAYIDAANLDKALRLTLLWQLDYKKFRVWLTEKYKVERAYINDQRSLLESPQEPKI